MRDLDQVLTELAEAYRPGPPPAFTVLQHRQRRRQRTRQVAAVAAVTGAVIAAAVLPTTLLRGDSASQPADGRVITASTTPSKPTDAPGPQPLAGLRFGPAIRECAAADLALSVTWQRSGPDLAGEARVAFAPGSKTACHLSAAEPSLVLLGPNDGPTGPRSAFQAQPAVTTRPVTPARVVSDAQPVVVPLRLTGSNCVISSFGSLVGLTNRSLQADFSGAPLPCDHAETQRDGQLLVGLPHTADEPAALVPVERQRLQVTLDAPADVAEGNQVRFLAHLQNPTNSPIALSPCPTYGVAVTRQDSDGTTESVRFGRLNCDDAPEAVPAGGELVFEMLADDPAAGQPRAHDAPELHLRWGIAGPPLAEATVTLRRPAPSGSPAAPPAASPVTSGCDTSRLTAADRERIAVYEAALEPFLARVAHDGKEPKYITDHPVIDAGAQPASGTSAFSNELLACLQAGTARLPALLPVSGFTDPRIPRSGPASRLTEGRLLEVSGLPEELPDTVEVFMSINGGGGFDYVNQTVRMVRSATGTWTVDQVLRSGIA